MSPSIKQKLSSLYLLTFLFTLHGALPLYVNSSFLGTIVPEGLVGLVYTFASACAIIGLVWVPDLLSRIGNYRSTLIVLAAQLLVTLLIAFPVYPLVSILLLTLHLMFFRIIGYNLDLFLERYSSDETTGGIRGVFLTVTNVAILIAPLLAGYIVGDDVFERIYLSSVFLLLPVVYLLRKYFGTFDDPLYTRIPFWSTIKKAYADSNIRHTMAINLLLRFFYAWMVIYMPIYLNQHIGFSWGEIGVMFSIMLFPFVLFEIPLGKLADTKYGEKEILTIGFILMGIATASIAFVTSNHIVVWTALLFLTRTGASMVEIMTESYFFKHIDGEDSPTLALFRIMQPAAYVIAPLVASIAFYLIPFNYLFLLLGAIVFYGTYHSLHLIDTR